MCASIWKSTLDRAQHLSLGDNKRQQTRTTLREEEKGRKIKKKDAEQCSPLEPKWRRHCECASMLVTQPDTSNQPLGLQFFHFIETFFYELHVFPSFTVITVHDEAVDLVVEVLLLERDEVLPAETQ